jgi:PAS domain S-box-containing protein
MNTDRNIRILMLEDLPEDYELAVRQLKRDGLAVEILRVETRAAYLQALTSFQPDLVISDYQLPSFDGLQALLLTLEHNPHLPFILLTGSMNEETAVRCMKSGASDYVLKEHLTRLPFAVREVLDKKQKQEENERFEATLARTRAHQQAIFDASLDAILVADDLGRYVDINPAACLLTGYSRAELLERSIWDLTPEVGREQGLASWHAFIRQGQMSGEYTLTRRDGSLIEAEFRAVAGFMPGLHLSIMRDITERKRAEAVLYEQQTRLSSIFRAAPVGIGMVVGRVIQEVNDTLCEMTGYARDELLGQDARLLYPTEEEYAAVGQEKYRQIARHGVGSVETRWQRKDGSTFPLILSSTPLDVADHSRGVTFTALDITQRKTAEEEVVHSQARLQSIVNILQNRDPSIEGFLEHALQEAISLTGSQFGFIFRYEEAAQTLTIDTWSPDVLAACRIADPKQSYALDDTGLWGEAVRQRRPVIDNDVQAPGAQKKGRPEGHIPLQRFMSVPVTAGESIVAVVGVANKTSDYDPRDVEQLALLMDAAWKSVVQREADARLHLQSAALEAAANAILITDPQGDIQWVNPAFEALTGYAAQEAVGLNPGRLIKSGLHEQAFYQQMWETILSGQIWRGELVNRRKDGQLYSEEATITPVLGTDGQIEHFVAVKQDITARRAMEAELLARDAILEVMSRASAALLHSSDWRQIFPEILEGLGGATGASRAYIFERLSEFSHEVVFRQAYEWVADGIEPQLMAPEMTELHMAAAGLGTWLETFLAGRPVAGHTREFSESEQRILLAQEIQSILVMPIFVSGDFWGLIGFDACLAEREWSNAEREALQVAASLLGEAVSRQQTEESLRLRLGELNALQKVSAALRVAKTTDEALDILLDETLAALEAQAGAINLYDPSRDQLWCSASRGWFRELSTLSIKTGEGITGTVFASGQAHITHDLAADPLTHPDSRPQIPPGWAGAILPIRNASQISGVLLVAVDNRRSFTAEQIRLLESLAELAGAALHRMSLYTETIRRLDYLQASQAVDRAISASLDLNVVLNVLVEHALTRLGVDATAVLLLDPYLHTLEYAAGRGFRTRAFEKSRTRLGEGPAGEAALERRTVHNPAIHRLPQDSPFAAACRQEGFAAYYGVPLIAKGQVKGVLEVYLRQGTRELGRTWTPDTDWLDFLEMLAGQAAIAIDNSQLFHNLQQATLELSFAYDSTIEGWSRALDLRDHETEGHTRRVTQLTLRLAQVKGIGETELVHIRRGALLHDIGKLGVPDHILHKPGPLTEAEWEMMRRHPTQAYEILAPIAYLRQALDIPYCHHEKWDGSGYPRGLAGEQIPLAARIFAVADVWDALTSDRPYRSAWTEARALDYIREQAGRHFDPQVVTVFLREMGQAAGEQQHV